MCHCTQQSECCVEALGLFCDGLYKQLRGLHYNVNVDARNLSRLTYCTTGCVLYYSFLPRFNRGGGEGMGGLNCVSAEHIEQRTHRQQRGLILQDHYMQRKRR